MSLETFIIKAIAANRACQLRDIVGTKILHIADLEMT